MCLRRYHITKWGKKYYVEVSMFPFVWKWIRYGDQRYPAYAEYDTYLDALKSARSYLELD